MKQNTISLNQLSGVIFDIDGVLVDTEAFQWLGWVEVLKPYDKTITEKDYLKYAGKQGDAIETELIEDLSLPLNKGELFPKKEMLLIEWFHSKELKLMPYAEDAVKYFQERKFRMACASGSPKDEALLKLQKTHLLHNFQTIVSGTDVKKGKPFPDIYLLAAKSINVPPDLCLAFEDTQYGVESAKAAGLICIAIPNAYSREQDFSKADGVFGSLKEAIRWIQET